jgi:hypothetical protein
MHRFSRDAMSEVMYRIRKQPSPMIWRQLSTNNLLGGPQENFPPQNVNYIPLKHQHPTTKPYSITSHKTKARVFSAKNLVKNPLVYGIRGLGKAIRRYAGSRESSPLCSYFLLLSCKVNLLLLINITTWKRIENWRKTPIFFASASDVGWLPVQTFFPLGICLGVHWTDRNKLIKDSVSMRERRHPPPPAQLFIIGISFNRA